MKHIKLFILFPLFFLSQLGYSQIHIAGGQHIELNAGSTSYLTPHTGIYYVHDFNKKQYAKIGITYFRNTLKVAKKTRYSDVILGEIPYFFNIYGTQKIFLNIGVAANIGYEFAPNLKKFQNAQQKIKVYDDKFIFGGGAIIELEYYLGANSALIFNIKGNYLSSDITDINGYLNIGYKFLIN